MRHILPVALVLSLVPLGAYSGELEIRTVHGAVLCATPFQLRKAILAAQRDETQRVWQLGCMRTGRGMKAILSDGIAPPYGPWQVRLVPDGGPTLTLWGYASSFRVYSDEALSPAAEAILFDDSD
jgi:hypothetical protein